MPLELTHDPSGRFVITVVTGEVDVREVSDWYRTVFANADLPNPVAELVDLSAADFSRVPTNGMRRIFDTYADIARQLDTEVFRLAVYSPYDLPFAMARVFSGWAVNSKIRARVCRDRDEAIDWLTRDDAAGV